MADGHQHHQRVLTGRRGRRVDAGRGMHINAGLGGQRVITEDPVERGSIVACQEHIVGTDLRIRLVHAPVEHQCRAGVLQLPQAVRLPLIVQKLAIDVREVGVSDDHVGRVTLAVRQTDARGPAAVDLDGRNRGIEVEASPMLLGERLQRLGHTVHTPGGEPHAIGQLGVLEQGVGGRGIEWAEPQVHVLEGEGCLEPRVVEVVADVRVVMLERLELEEQGKVGRAEVLGQAAEVTPDKPLERKAVVQLALGQVAQKAAEAPRLDRLEARLHLEDVGRQLEAGPVAKTDAVGRIDAPQVELIRHLRSEGSVGLLKDLRHQEQGGANVEAMAVPNQLIAAAAGCRIGFEHRHGVALASQPSRRGQAADARAHDDGRSLFAHCSLRRMPQLTTSGELSSSLCPCKP